MKRLVHCWLLLVLLLPLLCLPSRAAAVSGDADARVLRRLIDAGKWNEAEAVARRLAAGPGPARRTGLHGLGEIFLRQRRVDELFEMTEQAVKEFADSPDALAAHAAAWALKAQRSTHLMYRMSQAGKAVDWADRAIRLQEDQPLARFVRGLVNFHMPPFFNRVESAARDLRAVIASRDADREIFLPDSYWYLALCYRKLRNTEAAIRTLREAEGLWPHLAGFQKKRREFEADRKQ